MIDQLYKMLSPDETIKNAMPSIIEAFVSFYGEEKRSIIEEKFNELTIMPIQTPDVTSHIISKIKSDKTNELVSKFLKLINVQDNEKNRNIFFGDRLLSFDFLYSLPINNLKLYYEGDKRDNIKESVVDFLVNLGFEDVNKDNLDSLLSSNELSFIKDFVLNYNNVLSEYSYVCQELKPYEDNIKAQNDYKRNLDHHYFIKLVEEYKDLLDDEEYKQFKENANSSYIYVPRDSSIAAYIGTYLNDKASINSFSNESEEILKSGSDWKKQSIIKDRINFFNSLGINLGDNYDSYENSEECKKLVPSPDLVDEIEKKKEDYINKINNEYYKNLPSYKKNEQILSNENLIAKDNGHNVKLYLKEGGACVCPQLKIKNNEVTLHPLLFYCMSNMYEYMDQKLIHELNHVYELSLLELEGPKAKYKCGWDILEDDLEKEPDELDDDDDDDEKRPYELASEITNELISQEITRIMHSQGNYVFNTPDNVRVTGSSYQTTAFLIVDFIEYFSEILFSSRTGDIDILFDSVGKENFEEFCKLFDVFNDNFGGFAIINLYNDFEAKKTTDRTEKYREINEQKNKLLEKMKKHYEECKYVV